MKKAVILFSGGIDSSTVLAIAKQQGYACYALTFDYGQRHHSEVAITKKLAERFGVVKHCIFPLNINVFGGSALTDSAIAVPEYSIENVSKITHSYIPARNTIFLAIALAWVESLAAQDIFFGGCAADAAGFPDCRSEYIAAFEKMANLATQSALAGKKLTIHKPLVNLTKAETIKLGTQLGINYQPTVTCYQANEQGEACGHCESCGTRKQGFIEAGLPDITRYVKNSICKEDK